MFRMIIQMGFALFLLFPTVGYTQINLEWLERLKANVVRISAAENGFGFVVGSGGEKIYIATAAHVVLGPYFDVTSPELEVEYYSDRRTYKATLISFFENYDIALLEANAPFGLKWEKHCVDFTPELYEVVRFIGRNEDWVVSLEGQINRLPVGQIKADIIGIEPGSSGAPLTNETGIIGLIVELDGVQVTTVDITTIKQVLNGNRYNYFQLETANSNSLNTPLTDPDIDKTYKDLLAWRKAKKTNSIKAYEDYLKEYPNGEFLIQAKDAITELKATKEKKLEVIQWEIAKEKGTVEAYRAFQDAFPGSIYYGEAQKLVAKLDEKTVKLSEDQSIPEDLPEEEAGLVLVQAGHFVMGCTDEQQNCDITELRHEVSVKSFYISKTEVTNTEFCEFMNESGNLDAQGNKWVDEKADYSGIERIGDRFVPKEGYEEIPVVGVSWDGAVAFCEWKSKKTGSIYRLPTEAEWEYAARGGHMISPTLYAGSNTLEDVGWYASNSEGKPHPVGKKTANELGLFDMSGNVWEWCQDWYEGAYYKHTPKDDPKGPDAGSYKVIRGGSWFNFPWICRVGLRYNSLPNAYFNSIGFRYVKQP